MVRASSLMGTAAVAASIGVALLGVASCAGWTPHGPSAAVEMRSGAASDAERPFRVFATGDTQGWIEPCGCGVSQFGGLPRRASYLAAVSRDGDLRVDLGNAIIGVEPYQRLRLSTILEALSALDYQVFVPGQGELRLGPDFEVAARSLGERPRVVCANLVRPDGTAVFEPWAVETLPDGRRVAIVGLTQTPFIPFDHYTVQPADAALRRAVGELEGKVDAVVAATALPRGAELDALAAVPGVALVLAGRPDEGTPDLVRAANGAAPLFALGEQAWYVGRVDFDSLLRPVAGWQAWLDEEVPEDPAMADLAERYYSQVAAFGIDFRRGVQAQLRDGGFAGSETCRECHAEAYTSWNSSAHSHAMRTLVHKQQDRNPDCIPCHLQDLPPAGVSEEDAGVGCEACHGDVRGHAELARTGTRVPVRLLSGARHSCAQCHNEKTSAGFDFEKWWARIRH